MDNKNSESANNKTSFKRKINFRTSIHNSDDDDDTSHLSRIFPYSSAEKNSFEYNPKALVFKEESSPSTEEELPKSNFDKNNIQHLLYLNNLLCAPKMVKKEELEGYPQKKVKTTTYSTTKNSQDEKVSTPGDPRKLEIQHSYIDSQALLQAPLLSHVTPLEGPGMNRIGIVDRNKLEKGSKTQSKYKNYLGTIFHKVIKELKESPFIDDGFASFLNNYHTDWKTKAAIKTYLMTNPEFGMRLQEIVLSYFNKDKNSLHLWVHSFNMKPERRVFLEENVEFFRSEISGLMK